MNVFYLTNDQSKNAEWHVDTHVRKMILEYTQLLSAAYFQGFGIVWRVPDPIGEKEFIYVVRYQDKPEFRIYAKTHFNHPSAVWTRQSIHHWLWVRDMALALCKEFTYRFGSRHATQTILENMVIPPPLPDVPFCEPPPAMPDDFKSSSSEDSYRKYYALGKRHLHAWTNRSKPDWI